MRNLVRVAGLWIWRAGEALSSLGWFLHEIARTDAQARAIHPSRWQD